MPFLKVYQNNFLFGELIVAMFTKAAFLLWLPGQTSFSFFMHMPPLQQVSLSFLPFSNIPRERASMQIPKIRITMKKSFILEIIEI